jgi:hypothetical protein
MKTVEVCRESTIGGPATRDLLGFLRDNRPSIAELYWLRVRYDYRTVPGDALEVPVKSPGAGYHARRGFVYAFPLGNSG